MFETANTFTAKWEGGYVNHPNDPGGATNYGVSLRWLKDDGIDVDGDGKITLADIRALTPALAAALFRKHFWDRLTLDNLPPLAAIATYDAAVNTGRGQAVKFLQRACNALSRDLYQSLAEDGAIGPKTIARVTELSGLDAKLALLCVDMREAFHRQLADNSPYPDGRDYRPFLSGWLNRTRNLASYVSSLEV